MSDQPQPDAAKALDKNRPPDAGTVLPPTQLSLTTFGKFLLRLKGVVVLASRASSLLQFLVHDPATSVQRPMKKTASSGAGSCPQNWCHSFLLSRRRRFRRRFPAVSLGNCRFVLLQFLFHGPTVSAALAVNRFLGRIMPHHLHSSSVAGS